MANSTKLKIQANKTDGSARTFTVNHPIMSVSLATVTEGVSSLAASGGFVIDGVNLTGTVKTAYIETVTQTEIE